VKKPVKILGFLGGTIVYVAFWNIAWQLLSEGTMDWWWVIVAPIAVFLVFVVLAVLFIIGWYAFCGDKLLRK
jgi:hypothetical protein